MTNTHRLRRHDLLAASRRNTGSASASRVLLQPTELPAMAAGVRITKRMQELRPQVGACYLEVPELVDAVLLAREGVPHGALRLLKSFFLQVPQALHFALDISQMNDFSSVAEAGANAILARSPGDPHARFYKALSAAAHNDVEAYKEKLMALQGVAPKAASVLKRVVHEVALAWDARSYPPKTVETLPQDWIPEGPQPGSAAIVVFGCPVNEDGTPSPGLRERLQAARALAQRFPQAQVLVTGGAVSSSHPEGIFMRDWLISNGLNSDRIAVDILARDTLGNSMFVVDWLRRNPGTNSLAIVTSTWHSPRARLNLEGYLETSGIDSVNIVSVGAGSSDYPEPAELEARLALERQASYRDAARARGYFSQCDF